MGLRMHSTLAHHGTFVYILFLSSEFVNEVTQRAACVFHEIQASSFP